MKNFFKSIKPVEWIIWSVSAAAIVTVFFVFGNTQYHYLVGSLIGITALGFVSKGNPLGQVLTVVFSVFYGIISFSCSYYGEMITYLAMTAPMAVAALIVWLKNPYEGNKSEVKVNSLSTKERWLFPLLTAAVTVAFYFILQALNTANLIVSSLSVATSFVASYLTARRSRFYAVGYAVNDAVLIVMWILQTLNDITYFPMIVCFAAFLALDVYGFVNWTKMLRKQSASNGDGKSC
ncbi:MAG: nicotinamide riboside transporter PnuC [Corallococcus sp.]|nr:nicotinamide riboside transporter PnuC [Corallococcus sp.]